MDSQNVRDTNPLSPETSALEKKWNDTMNAAFEMDSENVRDTNPSSPTTSALEKNWNDAMNAFGSHMQLNPTPEDSDDEDRLAIDFNVRDTTSTSPEALEEICTNISPNTQHNLQLVGAAIEMLESDVASVFEPTQPVALPTQVIPEHQSPEPIEQQQHRSRKDSEDLFAESDVSVIEGTPVVLRKKKPNRASKRGSVGDVDKLTKRKSLRLTDPIQHQSQDASSSSHGQQPRTTVQPNDSSDWSDSDLEPLQLQSRPAAADKTPIPLQDSDEDQQISDEILRQIREMTHPVRVIVKRQSTAEPPAIPHRTSTRSFTQSSGQQERSSGDLQPGPSSIRKSTRNNDNHSVTGQGRNIGARYAAGKCAANRKVSLGSPQWLESLLFEYDSENSKTLQNVEKLVLAHRTWTTFRKNLSSTYGLSNYFDAKFWGKYFGRAKQPQNTMSMVSANGQNVRKQISDAFKSLVPNEQGQKRCFFLISSTIQVPPTTTLHSAVLVAVNEAEKYTYYYYETMADRPTDSYAPMNFVIEQLKDLTQLTGFHIIFGSQTDENDCFQRCINFVHQIASGDELISTDFYTMEKCSRGAAGLLYNV